MPNLKPVLDGTKIALERQAAEKFGAAVEEFSRGTLGPALGVPPEPTFSSSATRTDGSFYASSYAAALAGGTSYRPKLKFLFKVEFVFTKEAQDMFPEVLRGKSSQDFTFMVRSVDRPKIDFEYEDVNQYNFWTKALKKIRHRELTMTFMDDTGNRVLNFFRALMMIHSPITRRQMVRQNSPSYAEKIGKPAVMDDRANGMNFSQLPDARGGYDTAIRGTIDSQVGNAIETVRVKQIYVNPGSQLGSAVEETIFDFINARIISFDLDEVSHEGSDVNLVTMQFDYDWMEIVQVGPLQAPDGPLYDISVPGIHGAPVDISTYGGGTDQQGGGNPFANIITGGIGRAAQSLTSTAVNRAVKSVAGGGQFATLLGSHASNILGGLVGAAGRNLGPGLVNQAGAAFTNLNVITPSAQNVAPASAALSSSVADSAVGGRSPVESVVTSYPDPVPFLPEED